jgi:hypothetical protein
MSKIQQFLLTGDYVAVEKSYSDPAYTASAGDLVLTDTTGGAFTVSLPANPETGDRVIIMDAATQWGTNNLTIGRNGSNIDGSAGNFVANDSSNAIELFYSGDATVGWVSRSGAGSSGATNGAYAYFASGYTTTYNSSIEKMEFPFDSGTTTVVGTRTNASYGVACFNSSSHGFVCGGRGATLFYNTVDRVEFPFNTGTMTAVGSLSRLCETGSGFNSSEHGFVCEGRPTAPSSSQVTTIDRLIFPFDSGSATHVGNANLSMVSFSACNSSSHGYILGGINGVLKGVSFTERIAFPFASGTASIVGNLNYSTAVSAGCNSSNHGFSISGWNDTNRFSLIQRLTFPFDSGTTSAVGNLNNSLSGPMGANSSTYGYAAGGNSAASGNLSTISRITFPHDSGSSSTVGNLSTSQYGENAFDETDFNTQFV